MYTFLNASVTITIQCLIRQHVGIVTVSLHFFFLCIVLALHHKYKKMYVCAKCVCVCVCVCVYVCMYV